MLCESYQTNRLHKPHIALEMTCICIHADVKYMLKLIYCIHITLYFYIWKFIANIGSISEGVDGK